MKLQQQVKFQYAFHPINIAPMVNIVFLLLVFCLLMPFLTSQPGINVKLPKVVTSDIIKDENLAITITGENVIYFNNSIVTTKELRTILGQSKNPSRSVLIKADRRTSVGRIVDVWNLCRILGIEHINIATN